MPETCQACQASYTGIDGLRRVYACGAIYADGKVTRGGEVDREIADIGTVLRAKMAADSINEISADLRARVSVHHAMPPCRLVEDATGVYVRFEHRGVAWTIPAIREGRAGE